MRKLLTANFLGKCKAFWLIALGITLLAVLANIPALWNSLAYEGTSCFIEESLFQLIPYLPFICTLFVSLFLSPEFEEHTIRNKLIVGHTRRNIFFAADFTCMAACLLLLLGLLFGAGLTAALFSRSFQLPWTALASLTLDCMLLTMVFSTLCVAFIMNIPQKPSIFLTLFFLAMLYAASFLGARLDEAEMAYDSVTITVDGGVEMGNLIKNPAYIEGTTRTVYEFLYDLLPTGQTLQLNGCEFDQSYRWIPMSLMMLVLSTLAGYFPFRKREIK